MFPTAVRLSIEYEGYNKRVRMTESVMLLDKSKTKVALVFITHVNSVIIAPPAFG
jgi:hypothetical protein